MTNKIFYYGALYKRVNKIAYNAHSMIPRRLHARDVKTYITRALYSVKYGNQIKANQILTGTEVKLKQQRNLKTEDTLDT